MPFLRLLAICIFISILADEVYSAPKNHKSKGKSLPGQDEYPSVLQPSGYETNSKETDQNEQTDSSANAANAVKNEVLKNTDNLGNLPGNIDMNLRIRKLSKNEKNDFDLKEKEKEKHKKHHHHHHHSKHHQSHHDKKPIRHSSEEDDGEIHVLEIPQNKVKSSTNTVNTKLNEREKSREKSHKGSNQSSTELEDISIQFSKKNPMVSKPKKSTKYQVQGQKDKYPEQSQNIIILN